MLITSHKGKLFQGEDLTNFLALTFNLCLQAVLTPRLLAAMTCSDLDTYQFWENLSLSEEVILFRVLCKSLAELASLLDPENWAEQARFDRGLHRTGRLDLTGLLMCRKEATALYLACQRDVMTRTVKLRERWRVRRELDEPVLSVINICYFLATMSLNHL